MKKTQIIGSLIFCGSMLLFACGGSENTNTEDTNTDSTATEKVAQEEEVVDLKNCNLESFSFSLGDKKRTMKFSYDGNTLTQVETLDNGAETGQVMAYTFNEDGKLAAFTLDKSTATYVYDDEGKLTEITGEGSINTRTFEYDDNGNIIKQVTMFGANPYMTHEFTYEGDKPVAVKTINKKGVATDETKITYDDKPNPFLNKGVFINGLEMMFGYPVGNYKNNVVKMEKTYLEKTSYQIDGEYKNPGDIDTNEILLDYNDSGYPTTATRNKGKENEVVSTFNYLCE